MNAEDYLFLRRKDGLHLKHAVRGFEYLAPFVTLLLLSVTLYRRREVCSASTSFTNSNCSGTDGLLRCQDKLTVTIISIMLIIMVIIIMSIIMLMLIVMFIIILIFCYFFYRKGIDLFNQCQKAIAIR